MNKQPDHTPDTAARRSDTRVNRLVAAAVVNRSFRQLLLTKPSRALAQGFQGELFELDQHEENLILSIQANSLSEFARQLVDLQKHDQPPVYPGSGCWVPSSCSSVVLDAE